jgi:hypothetical protein
MNLLWTAVCSTACVPCCGPGDSDVLLRLVESEAGNHAR